MQLNLNKIDSWKDEKCHSLFRTIGDSEYLHPCIATPEQAVDSVDRERAATRHHGNTTLRASGIDESQDKASKQASRNEPNCNSKAS